MLQREDGATVARKLPDGDTGVNLNSSKYYVTFETNEGDTPRILVSAMTSAWCNLSVDQSRLRGRSTRCSQRNSRRCLIILPRPRATTTVSLLAPRVLVMHS